MSGPGAAPLRIVALGRTRMLWETIRVLRAAGHVIPLIATCRAAPEYDVREDDFRRLADEIGADFLQTQDPNLPEHVERLRACAADVAVSVNWISLIGPGVCSAFRFGVLNAHAGDLPRYRGNAPVAWAILNGEARVGLTIHQMDPHELDAGPILRKEFFPLTDATYVGEVFSWLDRCVPLAFAEAVAGLARGDLVPVPQPADPALSLRGYGRRPEDGWLDWTRGAEALARLVRASAEPFAGAWTLLGERRLAVWRARAEPWPAPALAVPGQVAWIRRDTGEVGIATGDGVLVLEQVQGEESERCAPAGLVRSTRTRVGRAPDGSSW